MIIPDYQLLAKQNIYTANKDIYAAELLFRSPMSFSAKDVGAELATHQVLANYCSSVVDASESLQAPVFINVDEDFVRNYSELPVNPEKVVIELNLEEDFGCDLADCLRQWVDRGFLLSLAGFDFSQKRLALLPLVRYIKVDVLGADLGAIKQKMAEVSLSPEQRWLAERIEDQACLEACIDAGFDLFQGYFLAKPHEVRGSSIRPGTAVTIRIVKELDRPDISMDQISDLVAQDPKLAVQMIKIINSSLFALPKPVDDLKSALVFLGIDMLRHWAMILAFLSNGSVHIEACRLILLRAKTTELLAVSCGDSEVSPSAFLSGLVSGVDVLIGVAPDIFLGQVELSKEVEEAVLFRKGSLGEYLAKVLDLELRVSQSHFSLSDVNPKVIEAYRAADAWVDQVVEVLKS